MANRGSPMWKGLARPRIASTGASFPGQTRDCLRPDPKQFHGRSSTSIQAELSVTLASNGPDRAYLDLY